MDCGIGRTKHAAVNNQCFDGCLRYSLVKRNSAKILVADDDTNLLDLLVDTLTTIGYSTVGVPCGFDALDLLKKEKFDLMITDIRMPGLDGVGLLKKVRSHYPDMPVLFMTGVTTPEIIGHATPDGFLAKPFRITHVEQMIEKALSGESDIVSGTVRKVLVVDDDSAFRDMLAEVLKREDFIPFAVSSGPEALKELENGEFDAVITDIKMPGMDGLELLKRIKEHHHDMPVILITAFFDSQSVGGSDKEPDADGFLRKPFKIEKVVRLLRGFSLGGVG